MCAFPNVTLVFLLALTVMSSLSITVNFDRAVKITAKRKIELESIFIECALNDMVRISAPMISEHDEYYLSAPPYGDTTKLELHAPKLLNKNNTHFHKNTALKYIFIKDIKALVNHEKNYHVFTSKSFGKKLKHLKPNEFMIGPLTEENYGNWVLSVYTKGHGEWIELFQVITLAITEPAVIEPQYPVLKIGDTFNLSFAYSLPAIETCEVIAPQWTFDRFFERTLGNFDKCGFSIPNVTKDDEGLWKIIGVGRIIHTGRVRLRVLGPYVKGDNTP
ncbi:uncharacterized protein LOC142982214 [Anticarsia gemmatalis]|uniref:uncharacterized protein LOC142982214 n=1 Tax=Anticarsia gemmatalis TaxID=129554 RepID=UPI003F76E2BE